MTWVKTSDDFHQRPALALCSRTARLLHHEALTYSNANNLGGLIPRALMRRITDEPDFEDAAAELVEHGAWLAARDGWQVIDSIDEQPTPEEIERQRKFNRDRQRRRRKHAKGDHSECQSPYCAFVTRDTQGAVTRDDQRESRPSHATPYPYPTRPIGRGKGDGEDPAGAGAPPDPAEEAAARLGRLPHPWAGDCCPLPGDHPIHNAQSVA